MRRGQSRSRKWVQHALSRALLACAVLPCASCLVTDRIEFGEQNVPPIVTRVIPLQFSRANSDAAIPCEDPEGDATDKPKKMLFEIDIYDANVDDTLDWRVVVNNGLVKAGGGTIDPAADRSLRSARRPRLQFCIPYSAFDKRCNYVQVAVSRKFAEKGSNLLEPDDADDVGRTEYFVLGDSNTAAEASELDCALWLEPDGGLL